MKKTDFDKKLQQIRNEEKYKIRKLKKDGCRFKSGEYYTIYQSRIIKQESK